MASKGKQAAASSSDPVPKVKAACQECRTRKTKCDGLRPKCTRCQQRNRPCDYDTEPDEFRITALKRRYAELAQSSSNHEALVKLLREGAPEDAFEIVNRIRADENITSILSGIGVSGGHAERNLISAIEEAKAPESHDKEFSTTPPRRPSSSNSAPRSINKASIAYLCEAVTAGDLDTVPGGGSTTLSQVTLSEKNASATSTQGSSDRAGSQQLESSKYEKRKRLSEPSLSKSYISPPLAASAMANKARPTPETERLASRPRSMDKSWMQRLKGVSAADWEVYYTDDTTFLEILKCYFVWENPSLGLVDEDTFWEGLVAKGSEFCNHALVHAILAFGSKAYGLFHPDRAASVEHFALEEMTKIWDWNADATVPANTSAGLLIHVVLTSNGQDEDGGSYVAGAWNLAARSGIFGGGDARQIYPSSDLELARKRAVFAWNVYAHHGYHTLNFSKPPFVSGPPPVEIPDVDPDVDAREWSPWPLEGPPRPSLLSSRCQARAKLWRVGNQILPMHKKHGSDLLSSQHWHETRALHNELREWQNGLNPRLNILHGAAPHIFLLHTDYHRCVIDLLRPFCASKDDESRTKFELAHRCTADSHAELRVLVHQMELQAPGLPVPLCGLLTPLVCVTNETLPLLPGKNEASDEVFYFCLCLKLMRRMAVAYPLMRFLILGLQQIANRLGVTPPPQAQRIVESLDQVRRVSQPINSFYPVHLDLLTSDMEAAKLSTLLSENGIEVHADASNARNGQEGKGKG